MTVTDPVPPRVIACCGGMVGVGGAERMMFEVLRTLRRRHAAVMCVVNDWENHRIVALAHQIGADFTTGPYHQPLRRHNQKPADILRMVGAIFRCSFQLLVLGVRFKPTHIVVPEIFSLTMNGPALLVLRLAGVHVIYHMHDTPPPIRFYHLFWRFVGSRLVDRFICVSDFVAEELRVSGAPTAKISRIYNTTPSRSVISEGGISRDSRRIIYVGQFLPSKGLSILLDAVGLLVARGFDPHLSVVGNAFDWIAEEYRSYRSGLFDRSAEADLVGRIEFLGWRDDVPSLMASVAVHCCPSLPELREACPLVVFEAKESGLPSVVFPSGGVPELIEHGRDGWISADVSAEGLARGLEYFIADPQRARKAGEAAKTSAERFSLERFRREWEEVFGLSAMQPLNVPNGTVE